MGTFTTYPVMEERELTGNVTDMYLVMGCRYLPEADTGVAMTIIPGAEAPDRPGYIASIKDDGKAGPDLLLVDMDNGDSPVTFNPSLSWGGGCTSVHAGQYCLHITRKTDDEYRIPLGVRVVIPEGSRRGEILTAGRWRATATLNISYQ
ncbi:hypothetical protein DSF71_13665 [Salmonella enterica subsp. enterica serovar Hvittingfoss]|nr:hypothetical protein [Salmonella enterica subsp. enterica serovar Hvittingfoss]